MCFKTLSQSQSLIINEISFASLHLLEYLFPGLTAGVVCCDCIACTWELDLGQIFALWHWMVGLFQSLH
jgi:hypothetical protein